MTHLNANCSGIWSAAEGTPVTVLATHGRVADLELCDAAAGYKVGKTVTLPASWIDGLEPEPVAVEVVTNTEPYPDVCPCCGQVLP